MTQASDGSICSGTLRHEPAGRGGALDDSHHSRMACGGDCASAIVQAADGSLWLGTEGGGVSRLDGEERWTTFTTTDGLVDDDVTAMAEAADGSLWPGTWGGVSRYDPALDAGH